MNVIDDLSSKCTILSSSSWIIDSGASHHMTYNKIILNNIRTLPYSFVIILLNGFKVTEIGDACLNPSLTLCKVILYLSSSLTRYLSIVCLYNLKA